MEGGSRKAPSDSIFDGFVGSGAEFLEAQKREPLPNLIFSVGIGRLVPGPIIEHFFGHVFVEIERPRTSRKSTLWLSVAAGCLQQNMSSIATEDSSPAATEDMSAVATKYRSCIDTETSTM